MYSSVCFDKQESTKKTEEAQERKQPAAYALALVCVVSMLAGMLIGNGVGHDAHVNSLE